MRALITADTVGGVWSYTRELVAGMLANNVSVVLVTLGPALNAEQSAWTDSIAAKFPGLFILAPTTYRLEWMEDAGNDVQESRRQVEALVHEYRVDLLHANQFCFASLDLAIPIVLVAHSDVQSWWRAVHGVPPPNTGWQRIYDRSVREGIHGASVVVAPTQWMLHEIKSIYGAPQRDEVIANGCSPKKFHTHQSKRLQAVSVGRLWDEGKNIRILDQGKSPMPILIAGDTRPPEGSDSAGFPVSGNINLQYLGRLTESEISSLLAESAIYVVPSRYEPFGLAAVEAAFSGCAIVENDIPSLHEVWGENALYYERNDADSLTGCLQRLAEEPLLLRQMSQAARRHAHAQFTASAMTAAYLNLYNQVLRSHLSSAHA